MTRPQAEAALRAAGHTMLDCPLSGTGAQARTKDLVVYASGDAQAINAPDAGVRGFLARRRTISAPSATA